MHTVPRIIENFPGNKSVKGLYHLIINNFPPHKFFYELTAGSAHIALIKAPADYTVVNDVREKIFIKLLEYSVAHPELNWKVMNENCLSILSVLRSQKADEAKNSLIYLDPPCIGRKIYSQGHDIPFHQQLIVSAAALKCNVMISHDEHPLYDNLVTNCGWRKKTLKVFSHSKYVVEAIYMNYPEPKQLQDYSLVGNDCWDRQRIKRKVERHIKKLQSLPDLEREAIIHAIKIFFPS